MNTHKKHIFFNKKESLKITNKGQEKLKKYKSSGKCMHPECSNNSIDSHTISKKVSLSTISFDEEVSCFLPQRNELKKELILKKVHINNATTFKGFCSKHDNILFKDIDNNPNIKNPKEIFLQSYRSICKSVFDEGYYKFILPSEESEDLLIKKIEDDIKNQFKNNTFIHNFLNNTDYIKDNFKNIISENRENISIPYRALLNYKNSLEKDIKDNYNNISIENIDATTKKILTSDKEVTILYKWLDWKIPVSIFNYYTFKISKAELNILNFTYIPYEKSSEIFWIFKSNNSDLFFKHWNSMISSKINILSKIESSMMSQENWCINPKIIDSLPEDRRKVLSDDMYFFYERSNFLNDYDMSIFDDIRNELINSGMCNIEKERDKFSIPIRNDFEIRQKNLEDSISSQKFL